MLDIFQKKLYVIIMSLVMFVTLIYLGNWQWERMAWKADILTLIEENSTAQPISLSAVIEKSKAKIEGINKAEYSRVSLLGHYHHDKKRYFFTQRQGQVGWTIYTPFEYEKNKFVFVNRGFIPDLYRKKQTAEVATPSTELTITGLFRMGLKEKSSYFNPDNAIKKNQYFWRSILDMSVGAFGANGFVITRLDDSQKQTDKLQNQSEKISKILPFSLDLEKNDHNAQWPQAGTTILKPANNHFTYMMTWFSFALTLLIITGFFLAGERRKA